MSNGNTLYLECRSGISGDMTVAALLDLGATEENLRAELAKLPVDGYEIQVKKIVKSGLLVSDFDDTLYGEDMRITRENVEALTYFTSRGGIFTVATGRAPAAKPHVAMPTTTRIFSSPFSRRSICFCIFSTCIIFLQKQIDQFLFCPLF